MNLISFVDELVKVGGMRCLYKRADDAEVNTVDPPHGMISHDPMPPAMRVNPAESSTRLPRTAHLPSQVSSGQIGEVSTAKDPIDREKFNRAYGDRR